MVRSEENRHPCELVAENDVKTMYTAPQSDRNINVHNRVFSRGNCMAILWAKARMWSFFCFRNLKNESLLLLVIITCSFV